jgi:transposase
LIGCGRQAPCSEAGGYLFANARATRVKLLVHDGFGVRCAARRLNTGHFMCPGMTGDSGATLTLTQQQFDALVVGLPWQRLQQSQVVTRVQTLQWQRLIARCCLSGRRCAKWLSMLDARHLKAEDLQGLDAAAASRIATLLLKRVAAPRRRGRARLKA